MPNLRNSDEEPIAQPAREPDQPPAGDDTEGHMLQLDPNTARNLARARSADVDRDARERQLRKEARPNRR